MEEGKDFRNVLVHYSAVRRGVKLIYTDQSFELSSWDHGDKKHTTGYSGWACVIFSAPPRHQEKFLLQDGVSISHAGPFPHPNPTLVLDEGGHYLTLLIS